MTTAQWRSLMIITMCIGFVPSPGSGSEGCLYGVVRDSDQGMFVLSFNEVHSEAEDAVLLAEVSYWGDQYVTAVLKAPDSTRDKFEIVVEDVGTIELELVK